MKILSLDFVKKIFLVNDQRITFEVLYGLNPSENMWLLADRKNAEEVFRRTLFNTLVIDNATQLRKLASCDTFSCNYAFFVNKEWMSSVSEASLIISEHCQTVEKNKSTQKECLELLEIKKTKEDLVRGLVVALGSARVSEIMDNFDFYTEEEPEPYSSDTDDIASLPDIRSPKKSHKNKKIFNLTPQQKNLLRRIKQIGEEYEVKFLHLTSKLNLPRNPYFFTTVQDANQYWARGLFVTEWKMFKETLRLNPQGRTDYSYATIASTLYNAMCAKRPMLIQGQNVLVYNEGWWQRVGSISDFYNACEQLLYQPLVLDDAAQDRVCLNNKMYDEAAKHLQNHFASFDLKPKPGINFKDGFYDGFNLHDHRPQFFATHKMEFTLDEAKKLSLEGTRFGKFLDEIFEGEEHKDAYITTLQMYEGACLSGNAARIVQTALLLLGTEGNGKSTYQRATALAYPKNTVSELTLPDICTPQKLEGLKGILRNSPSEAVPKTKGWENYNSSTFKLVITGDTVIPNTKYEKCVPFQPIAGHIFSLNNLPNRQFDAAELRRLRIIIPFRNSFTKNGTSDIKLDDELSKEQKIIQMWVTQGYLKWMENHCKIPTPPCQEKEDWFNECDHVATFLKENGEFAESGELENWPLKNLQTAYNDWAREEELQKIDVDLSWFSKLVQQRGVKTKRVTINGKKEQIVTNYRMANVQNTRVTKNDSIENNVISLRRS